MLSIHENPHEVNGDMNKESTSYEIGHNGGPPLDDAAFPKRGGYVKVTREMRDHHLVGFGSAGYYTKAEAWIDLIMECKYKAGVVNNGGRPMMIKPGQLVGAVSWLAHRWNWTPKEVRYFLDRLQDEGMIERFTPGTEDENASPSVEKSISVRGQNRGKQKGKQASIISVCNYEIYQFVQRIAGQAKGQATGEQGASKGQARGNNLIKEESNKGKETHTDDGAVHQGEGVYLTEEHVQHEQFSISLRSLQMQLVLAKFPGSPSELMELAKTAAVAYALQWASDINRKRHPASVLPDNPAMFIRGAIVSGQWKREVHDKKLGQFAPTRAKAAATLDKNLTPEQQAQARRLMAEKRGTNV